MHPSVIIIPNASIMACLTARKAARDISCCMRASLWNIGHIALGTVKVMCRWDTGNMRLTKPSANLSLAFAPHQQHNLVLQLNRI
jgi:hypothetical protein